MGRAIVILLDLAVDESAQFVSSIAVVIERLLKNALEFRGSAQVADDSTIRQGKQGPQGPRGRQGELGRPGPQGHP
jgi:hypothetical protein